MSDLTNQHGEALPAGTHFINLHNSKSTHQLVVRGAGAGQVSVLAHPPGERGADGRATHVVTGPVLIEGGVIDLSEPLATMVLLVGWVDCLELRATGAFSYRLNSGD